MSDLVIFQHDFLRRIDAPAADRAALAVYRNTALLGAISALADNFPTVRMIVGDGAMEALATGFAERCPPSSPILVGYGAPFPDWLEAHPIAAELPYLAAVARIDRLRVEAHLAADAPEFGLEGLARMTAEEWSRARVQLHPATRLAWFAIPAPSIWVAHLGPEPDEIAPDWQAEGILVARRDGAVSGFVIGGCEHRILHGLRLGETVGEAALAASRLHPGSNITRAFRRLVASGAFTTPRIKGARS